MVQIQTANSLSKRNLHLESSSPLAQTDPSPEYEPPTVANPQTPIPPGIPLETSKIKAQDAAEASPSVFGMLERVYQFLSHSQLDSSSLLAMPGPSPNIMLGLEQIK